MTDKEHSAELLLDAIGQIDDQFIYEAEITLPQKASVPLFRKLSIVGLSVALAFTVAISSLIGALIHNEGKGDSQKPSQEDPNDIEQDIGAIPGDPATDLSDTFMSLKSSTTSMSADIESIDLFDKKTKIIWKYSDEEDYRVCTVSNDASENIVSLLKKKADFTEVEKANESSEFEGVWISFGDGLVYSPCLKASAGNVGVGAVFGYVPELEPTREFIDTLTEAINESK